MGTRGLTMVLLNGVERVAQYGQWDHYPEGQGVTVLNFCRKNLKATKKRGAFVAAVEKCRFISDAEVQAKWRECGANDSGWVNQEVSGKFNEKYPALYRDAGAKILELVLGGATELFDSKGFMADSLFCEWAYCVNLDANVLEVYQGFQESAHKSGRYCDLPVDNSEKTAMGISEYYPCRLVAEFPLDKLPTKREFLRKLNKVDRDA